MTSLRDKIEEILRKVDIDEHNVCIEFKSMIEATNQILQAFEEVLPPEEDEAQLCKCDNVEIDLKMPENLIWCMACNKQHGGKTHNSCLAQIRKDIWK